jgi:hypothetical protein
MVGWVGGLTAGKASWEAGPWAAGSLGAQCTDAEGISGALSGSNLEACMCMPYSALTSSHTKPYHAERWS